MKRIAVRFLTILVIVSFVFTAIPIVSQSSLANADSASIAIVSSNIEVTITEAKAKTKTGLYKVKGVWKYYENGKFKSTTGLVKKANAKGWFFVRNGVFSKETGLVKCVQPGKNKGKWFFVRNGAFSKETGLVKCIHTSNKGKWFFVKKGAFKKSTGFCESIQPGKTKGRKYYVKKGSLAINPNFTKSGNSYQTDYFKASWTRNPSRGDVSFHKGNLSANTIPGSWWISYGSGSEYGLAGGLDFVVVFTGTRVQGAYKYFGMTSDGLFQVYSTGGAGGDISSVINVKVK